PQEARPARRLVVGEPGSRALLVVLLGVRLRGVLVLGLAGRGAAAADHGAHQERGNEEERNDLLHGSTTLSVGSWSRDTTPSATRRSLPRDRPDESGCQFGEVEGTAGRVTNPSWACPSWACPSWPRPSWPRPSWPRPSWPRPSWPRPSWPR